MNAVTDEEVRAACREAQRYGQPINAGAARAILTAALSIRQGGVKALEWREDHPAYFRAGSVAGIYAINFYAGLKYGAAQLNHNHGPAEYFDTLEEAKAAAQADFNARILSALSPAQEIADKPSAVSVGDVDLRNAIADAIAAADVGFSMNLVRLVDGVHTYTLKYSDGETLEFCDDDTDDYDAQDRLYAHVRARKRQLQADAVLSALKAAQEGK